MNKGVFDVSGWVFLKGCIISEERKVRLEAIGLICIYQKELYLYILNGWKRDSLALVFMCNIGEIEDVIYDSNIGRYEVSFRAKQSEIKIRFRKRRVWENVKKIIDGGMENETKYKS